MDSFLDTNVIFKYSLYGVESQSKLFRKCFNWISSNKELIIVCYRVLRELDDLRLRYKLIYYESLKKLNRKDYEIGSSVKINKAWFHKKDFPLATRIYLKYKDKRIEYVKKEFNKILVQMNFRLDYFKEKLIGLLVIPEEKIDKELVSKLHNFINNHADCEILASAITFQENRKPFLFVTADRDFAPNDYAYVKEDPGFGGIKFPVLKNLLF